MSKLVSIIPWVVNSGPFQTHLCRLPVATSRCNNLKRQEMIIFSSSLASLEKTSLLQTMKHYNKSEDNWGKEDDDPKI